MRCIVASILPSFSIIFFKGDLNAQASSFSHYIGSPV